ncbi:optineurin-like [Lytechinus pictus]|uniref:optineurin-like n=1 Tax=Lytechinus pictus TaxID=7653 RepID=UPI0030B9FFE0
MNDDRLLTTDPNQHIPRDGRSPTVGLRPDNNPMMQSGSGMLTTFINSEEMRTAAESALNENRQLKEQYAQAITCLGAWKPKIVELENFKAVNAQLKKSFVDLHDKSRKKVQTLQEKIKHLQEQISKYQNQESPDLPAGGQESYCGPILGELKHHMQAVEQILREELSSMKQEHREKDILEKLMDHIKKAEEILATEDVEMYQGPSRSLRQEGQDPEPQTGKSPSRERKPTPSPLSPTGQRAYDQSMENVLGQLQNLQQQVADTNSALTKERMRNEALDTQLKKSQAELRSLQGMRESHVAEAIERQRQEDDMKHKTEMDEMMAKLDELTLLAAEKHQKQAFDEEPRYHSASNELKQQVTSLVAELDLKDRYLDEEKSHVKQQQQVNEQLQRRVTMYHDELAKARREAQSYIDTVHVELKRKETLCQSERQKALHEKLQHDKCKEELGASQVKLNQLLKDKSKYQEKEDRYLAEILSAEEAIEAKEREKLKFEQLAKKYDNERHIWKEQMEVCKDDFKAERKARENMHTEKGELQAKIENLLRENKKMESELQDFHREQLHAVAGTAYGPTTGFGYDRRGGGEMFGMRRHVYEAPGEDEAGNVDRFQETYQPQELRTPQQATTANWCPKCQLTFPDYDTLNIHIADCID